MLACITDFHVIRPRFEIPQETTLDWLAEAHSRAEAARTGSASDAFYQEVKDRLYRLGFGKDKIQSRGVQIDDLYHQDWSTMPIYPVGVSPEGVGFTERSKVFDREVSQVFEAFYPVGASSPDHLIHVTCTGYVAPSPAQKIVSKRNFGQSTVVTHAYHMGCYGSIPALRMSSGFLHLPSPHGSSHIDIVHTEFCSLHMHPMRHSTEQLIVQSLFADGFIKYAVRPEAQVKSGEFLKMLALSEETIPDSTESMTWRCEDQGLGMTLAKEVPVLISRGLPGYLKRLFEKAGTRDEKKLYYAVHFGGPKILAQVQKILNLEDEQLRHTHEILRTCGNMSSATLPHIWNLMLNDPSIPEGSQIVSMAFGPGLSIAGGLFEKRRI